MYIAWQKRPVKGDKPARFLQDDALGRKHPDSDVAAPWKPLYCEHRGPGRVAWTPLVVHAERRDGRPRQVVLHRLPTIRSCCILDTFRRAAWWHDVERAFRVWWEAEIEPMYGFLARDRAALVAKLREVVPRPTRAGDRDFAAYRLWRERERQARWARRDPARWRAEEEAARRPDAAAAEAVRRGDAEWRLYEGARGAAEASARAHADGLSGRHRVVLGGRAGRASRAEADWARFEQAIREHEERLRRWDEGRERRRREEERRAEGRRRQYRDDLLGGTPGPAWHVVLGLAKSATRDEIKRRYRQLSMQHHPDRGGDERRFIAVKAAYDAAMRQAAST